MKIIFAVLDNIIRVPAILLAIIAGIGLIAQKKDVGEVIKGMALTAIGMMIIEAGVGYLFGTIAPISDAFHTIFPDAAITEGLNDATFTAQYGGTIGIVMAISLVVHVLVARFTRFKVLFLTGHFIWWFPFVYTAAMVQAGVAGWLLIVLAVTFTVFQFSVMPWIVRKYIFAATGDETFTLGHSSTILCLTAGFVASKVGDKSYSTEDLKLPKGLSFFREISVSGSIILFLVYMIVGIWIPVLVPETENIVFFSIKQGLSFGAGLTVLLAGVRLLIGQIVPSFKGISEKIVPDAIPGFDCPLLFNYRPNAVLIGFVINIITTTLLMIICNVYNVFGVLLVPMVIISFFECGAAAVVADAQGGLRGAIIGSIATGFVVVFLAGVSAAFFSDTIQNWMLVFGGNDCSLFGTIAGWIGKLFAAI